MLVELEAAKLQVSTLKAQLIASHEAADSARAASDSLTQQMKTSAETELSKVLQKVNAAEAEVQHLQCRLANTQAGAQSEAAKLLLVLDKSRAKQEEEFKKVHQKELQAEVQRPCCACLPRPIKLQLFNCSVQPPYPQPLKSFWVALPLVVLTVRLHALSPRLVSTCIGACNAHCM